MKKAAVIMGSDSDWPVVKAACQQLDAFGIPYEAHILSAHRSPVAAADFAKTPAPTASACSSAQPEWRHTSQAHSPATPPCRSSASP